MFAKNRQIFLTAVFFLDAALLFLKTPPPR